MIETSTLPTFNADVKSTSCKSFENAASDAIMIFALLTDDTLSKSIVILVIASVKAASVAIEEH